MRVLGREPSAMFTIDVPSHGARLVQRKAVVVERGHLPERLTREVRGLLVLTLGKVDDHELERRAVLVQCHQHFARARTNRVAEDFHRR